jgi:hypothetical protein
MGRETLTDDKETPKQPGFNQLNRTQKANFAFKRSWNSSQA